MRCFVCGGFSLPLVCGHCKQKLLSPSLIHRKLDDKLEVFSFYPYSEIEPLLLTKHTMVGSTIFRLLASESFSKFAANFSWDGGAITALPIDDDVSSGYSHTAILARALHSDLFRLCYGKLRASNRVKYSGKTLQFRLSNPRGFVYSGKPSTVVLVDDIVTTGTTLLEAKAAVERAGCEVAFALTLADARV